jgi:hypothetical protein
MSSGAGSSAGISGGIGSALPGSGGTGPGSRGPDLCIILLSPKRKRCPPFGGHPLLTSYDKTLLIPVLWLTGLLARLTWLLVGLLVLALLLFALLALPLLLITLLLRLLRVAFLGVVHR